MSSEEVDGFVEITDDMTGMAMDLIDKAKPLSADTEDGMAFTAKKNMMPDLQDMLRPLMMRSDGLNSRSKCNNYDDRAADIVAVVQKYSEASNQLMVALTAAAGKRRTLDASQRHAYVDFFQQIINADMFAHTALIQKTPSKATELVSLAKSINAEQDKALAAWSSA